MERPSRQRQQERESEQQSDETVTCPECSSDEIITDADQGELVCDDCGLVLDERQIDRGPEWRAFNHSERQNKSRVGAPITETMHDRGLTTTIDWKDKDAYGRSLSSEKRSQMHRLRKWQERIRTKDAGERNLQFALSEIDRMASALGVPRSVREVASVIYRRALNEDLIRGRSIEGVATAALYAACRQEGIPRSLDEVAEVSRVPQKEIGRTYRYISQELGLNSGRSTPSSSFRGSPPRSVSARKYRPRRPKSSTYRPNRGCSPASRRPALRPQRSMRPRCSATKRRLNGRSPTLHR